MTRGQIERYGAVTAVEGLIRIDTTDFSTVDYATIIEGVRGPLDSGGSA